MVEIENVDDLEVWLQTQRVELSAIVAARAALRLTPMFVAAFEKEPFSVSSTMLLCVFRASLNAVLIGTWPSEHLELAVHAANSARQSTWAHMLTEPEGGVAYAAGRSADTAFIALQSLEKNARNIAFYQKRAADYSARVFSKASDLTNKSWQPLRADVAAFEMDRDLGKVRAAPLWEHSFSTPAELEWGALDRLMEQHFAYHFWRKWYQSTLNGEPQNWEKLQQIVLIDDAIWDAGPEAVAGQIAIIEAKYTPQPIPKIILHEQVTILIQNATTT